MAIAIEGPPVQLNRANTGPPLGDLASASGLRCRFCDLEATRYCQVAGFVCDECEEVAHRLVRSG